MSFKVTLRRVRRLSKSTLDFRFERDDGGVVEFEPGQFFRFTFTDEDGEFERSYSLCNFGEDVSDSPYLDLVISWVDNGRASKLLFNADEGLTAEVAGPYGRLVLPDPMPKRLFLVATSVGIAPFMPMLSALEEIYANNPVEVYLLFGVREPEEFIYGDVLVPYAQRHPQFHLTVCYSRTVGSDEYAFDGYVQDALGEMTVDPADDIFFLCGNPQMIDEVFADLKARGIPSRHVVREKYVYARESGADNLKKPKKMTDEQKKLLAEKMKKYQS